MQTGRLFEERSDDAHDCKAHANENRDGAASCSCMAADAKIDVMIQSLKKCCRKTDAAGHGCTMT